MASQSNKLGKFVNKLDQQIDFNTRRVSRNFPVVERSVGALNQVTPFTANFKASAQNNVSLSLYFRDYTPSCTISPGTPDVMATVSILGVYPIADDYTVSPAYTYITNIETSDKILEAGDFFTQDNFKIIMPVDGCYGVFYSSDTYGIGYPSNGYMSFEIYNNDVLANSLTWTALARQSILGPSLYEYQPPKPVYTFIPCKAGDKLEFKIKEYKVDYPIPWVAGTQLRGFLANLNGTIEITLIGSAE